MSEIEGQYQDECVCKGGGGIQIENFANKFIPQTLM